MSDVEFITGVNHQRAREREWNKRRAERDGLREKRERVRRTALSACWLAGAFLSGMALVLLAFGGAAAISAVLGSVLYEL